MIEESEKLKLTPAIKRYDFLKDKISCDIGLIHGSLSKNEKDQIMEKFIDGNIKCIISTTVIEVGIDNPNANSIVIENAERFFYLHLIFPLYHSHLFDLAKDEIEKLNEDSYAKFKILLKIFKKDKVLNIIDTG